jgi:hypothetical protein
MNSIYFNKFSVRFHHCDEFDVFFVPDAVRGLRAKTARVCFVARGFSPQTADVGWTELADGVSNMGGLLELLLAVSSQGRCHPLYQLCNTTPVPTKQTFIP